MSEVKKNEAQTNSYEVITQAVSTIYKEMKENNISTFAQQIADREWDGTDMEWLNRIFDITISYGPAGTKKRMW